MGEHPDIGGQKDFLSKTAKALKTKQNKTLMNLIMLKLRISSQQITRQTLLIDTQRVKKIVAMSKTIVLDCLLLF